MDFTAQEHHKTNQFMSLNIHSKTYKKCKNQPKIAIIYSHTIYLTPMLAIKATVLIREALLTVSSNYNNVPAMQKKL